MAGQFVQWAPDAAQVVFDPTSSLTLPAPVTAGNLLVLAVDATSNSLPVPSLPTGGGTWVAGPTRAARSGIGTSALFYCLSATGGPTTVSIDTGGLLSYAIVLMEFSGVTPALPQPDATNDYAWIIGSESTPPPPQIVTVHDADLIVSIAAAPAPNGIVSAAGGFAMIAAAGTSLHPGQPTLDSYVAAAWRNTTVHGGYSPAWNVPNLVGNSYDGLELAFALRGEPAALAATDAGEGGDFAMLTAPANIVVPAAVVDLPDRHIFGGVDLATLALIKVKSFGADSHPALRGENPAWAGLPGTQSLEQLPASRLHTIDLFVHGTSDVAARANLDALHTVLAMGVEQRLVRVMPDGSGRQAMAKVWSVQEIDGAIPGSAFRLRVEFYLADPWFYANSVIDSDRELDSTSVAFTLTHPGTVRGHHVLLDLLGPMSNPRITNLTTGTWVQFDGDIGNNQRLYIDSEHFSALLNGANVVGSISHGGGVPFLWIAPGDNSLLVETTDNGGTLSTTFSPPYI